MLTKDRIVELLQKERSFLAAEFGVSKVGLFGSYAKGQARETSDIDLLLEFDRPIGFRFLELVDYLEFVLGRKVDVLTPAGIRSIRIDRVARSINESIVYIVWQIANAELPRLSKQLPDSENDDCEGRAAGGSSD